MPKAYEQHLRSPTDLETSYQAVRAGFVALALEKNRRATPFVAEARALKAAASKAKTPADLLKIPGIRAGLVTAAGVSDKASTHLTDADKTEAIAGLIAKFLDPAGDAFVEELVFRFLLTRGDTLGGSMRNVGGFMAQCKLTRSVIANLRLSGTPYYWLHKASDLWTSMPDDDSDIEQSVRGISWTSAAGERTLVYNLTVPLFKNNVDLCLFGCNPGEYCKALINAPDRYIALGELKGGIDPAGADEHWKTARTAITRIRSAFATKGLSPHVFFIGAAIEARMSVEIWDLLVNGTIENAANLTNEDHIASVTRWLCSL